MSQYFSKPHEPFGGDINVKVYLSNYATKVDLKNATKTDLKNATDINTSKSAKNFDLAILKSNVDKLYSD